MGTGAQDSSAAPRYSQDNGHDGQELARRRELHAIVHLLPVREQPSLPLVRSLKRSSFHGVQEDVHTLQQIQTQCEAGRVFSMPLATPPALFKFSKTSTAVGACTSVPLR